MEMTEKPTGSGVARWSFYLMGLLILAMGLTLNTKAGLGSVADYFNFRMQRP